MQTSRRPRAVVFGTALALTLPLSLARAQAVTKDGPAARGDSAAVADVVRRYGAALSVGDSLAALALLAPDAVILETGGVETRDEYRSHHLAGDIGYARAVRSEDSAIRVTLVGDAAWAWSTSITTGEYRGRTVNNVGAELMVLSRGADGRWVIRAIHWSSRARRTQPPG